MNDILGITEMYNCREDYFFAFANGGDILWLGGHDLCYRVVTSLVDHSRRKNRSMDLGV